MGQICIAIICYALDYRLLYFSMRITGLELELLTFSHVSYKVQCTVVHTLASLVHFSRCMKITMHFTSRRDQ